MANRGAGWFTWLPDDTFSDVVSPLPAQPESDYDYASALATKRLSSWVDGRVPINGTYQQDAFADRELVTATPTTTPQPTPTPRPRPTPHPQP